MEALKKTFKGVFYCFTNFNSDNWIYKTVALIGLVLRIWLLPIVIPDVFEVIAELFISQLNFQPWLYEIVIRIILLIIDSLALSNIFYWLSYISVGNCYEGGSSPAWGSVCYTIYYFIYMAIPVILIQFFSWWVIILTFSLYAVISFILYFVSAKIDTLPDSWILRLILHIICFIVVVVTVCLVKGFVF